MLLHIHKDLTDSIEEIEIAKEFSYNLESNFLVPSPHHKSFWLHYIIVIRG